MHVRQILTSFACSSVFLPRSFRSQVAIVVVVVVAVVASRSDRSGGGGGGDL